MQTISKRLRELLKKSETPVRSLALDAALNPQTVHNILDGKTWPDLPTIHRLEVVLGERLWVNSDLPWGVEQLSPRKFYRRAGATFYLESDGWETVIAPTNSGPESWSWNTRRLTDKGWTPDGEGTAADPQDAEQAADQHIADRTAPEPSQPDEQPERQRPERQRL